LLFDKFIIDGPKQKEFVCGGYQNIEIDPESQKNVRKISITLLRNITGFPLVPGLSKKQRLEVMDVIEKCCEEFDDDLKGTFYKLEEISESEKKIIQDINLRKPDETTFEDMSNQGKDWPSGRAIFTNVNQSFYIQVNGTDHMKIHFSLDNVNI
jgi:creatine kinase